MKFLPHLLFVCLLANCSGPSSLKSEIEPGTDFSKYSTFDFYKFDASGDTSLMFPSRAKALQDAVAIELTNKGYKQSSDNPDLLVNIGLVIKEKAQTRETNFRDDAPRYIGQRNYSWKSEEVVVRYYREGSVTMDLVDRVANKRIWEGAAKGVIPGSSNKVQKEMDAGVKVLLAKIPSKK